MSRNPIGFIFRLGKHHPLPLRPLIRINTEVVGPSTLLTTSLITRKSPLKIEQVQHSNQMSS